MDENLASPAQRLEECLDAGPVVRVGGVHHGIGGLGLPGQDVGIVQGAQYGCDPQCLQGVTLARIADQAADLMIGIDQVFGHGATNVAGGAGNENFHGGPCC
ncbi:hypothetical protein D9M68_840550 [compost metagenome]